VSFLAQAKGLGQRKNEISSMILICYFEHINGRQATGEAENVISATKTWGPAEKKITGRGQGTGAIGAG
jgi:hypothetical protein